MEIIKTANLFERNFRTARVDCDKRKELDVNKEAGNSFLTPILSLKDES